MQESASMSRATRRVPPATSSASASGGICLRLLSRFSLEVYGQPGPVWNRAERVLVLLAIRGGTARRAAIAGTLWPETTSERSLSSLRTALWSLNRLHLPLVHAGPSTLSLVEDVQVDLHVAVARAQELIDNRHPRSELPETLRLLRQDLLCDWSEDWITIEQERFRQLRLHGLEALSELLTRSGRHAQAVDVGLEAMACDPLRESAHRLLMSAYLAEGNRKEAINQFHLCARLLRDELGLNPSAEMTGLLWQATSPAG